MPAQRTTTCILAQKLRLQIDSYKELAVGKPMWPCTAAFARGRQQHTTKGKPAPSQARVSFETQGDGKRLPKSSTDPGGAEPCAYSIHMHATPFVVWIDHNEY